MERLAGAVGWTAGAVGVMLMVIALAGRMRGLYRIAGFDAGTLLQAGTAAMVLGCFCLLVILADASSRRS